jgi:hypothetical protein
MSFWYILSFILIFILLIIFWVYFTSNTLKCTSCGYKIKNKNYYLNITMDGDYDNVICEDCYTSIKCLRGISNV